MGPKGSPSGAGSLLDRDPALRRQVFDATKSEREPEIEPDRVLHIFDYWQSCKSSATPVHLIH